MKSVLLATLAILLFAPLASAGPGASVSTLEGRNGCDSGYYYGNDGNSSEDSWWSSSWSNSWSQCSDSTDYAAASADDGNGEAARVTVSADHQNASNDQSSWNEYGSPGYSGRSQNYYSSDSDKWSRGGSVETRSGSASAGHGCDASNAYSSGWGSAYRDSSSWSNYGSNSQYQNGCGDRVESDVGGTPLSVGEGNGCESTADNYGGSNYETNWGSSSSGASHSDGCVTGADASAAGNDAAAGWQNACSNRRFEYQSWSTNWDGNETYSNSYNETASGCSNGAFVAGPDGATLFAGEESSNSEWCDSDGNCYQNAADDVVLRLAWEHNPLQPTPIVFYAPLP